MRISHPFAAQALAVHPDLRRTGVATAMLDYVDGVAREKHLDQLVLHVEDDNDPAITFYEAANFKRRRSDAQFDQFATSLGLAPDRHALYTRPVGPPVATG